MWSIFYYLSLLLIALISCAHPALITRVHTAKPKTVTNTFTTGTTTLHLPPVEILVSDGVTHTLTLSEHSDSQPTTFTSLEQNEGSETSLNNEGPISTSLSSLSSSTPSSTPVVTSTNDASSSDPSYGSESSTSDLKTSKEIGSRTSTSPTSQFSSTTLKSSQATSVPSLSTQDNEGSSSSQQSTNTPPLISSQLSSSSSVSTTSSQQTTSSQSSTSSLSSSIPSDKIDAPKGIVYSPYSRNGGCKDKDTIYKDLDSIKKKGITTVRLYGTDCNLFAYTLPSAKQLGLKVNQGLWISSNDMSSIEPGIKGLVDYGKKEGFDNIEIVTIGNEVVTSNYANADQLLSKVKLVSRDLKDAGYKGMISTGEQPGAFSSNPSLCTDEAIDVVSLNVHSYFDPNIDASQAGSFVMGKKKSTEQVCKKKTIISETGYPSRGNNDGRNYASAEDQKKALKSIIESTNRDVTILSSYNDMWKQPGPYGVEQYFGSLELFA